MVVVVSFERLLYGRRQRIPEGDSWQDHAVPCPNCDQPVLYKYEHKVGATDIDPEWWTCDAKEPENESQEPY